MTSNLDTLRKRAELGKVQQHVVLGETPGPGGDEWQERVGYTARGGTDDEGAVGRGRRGGRRSAGESRSEEREVAVASTGSTSPFSSSTEHRHKAMV